MSMRKRLSIIGSLIGCVAILLCGTLRVHAERQFEDCIPACQVYDHDNVLTDSELEDLNALVRKTSDTIDMYVAVCIYGEDAAFSSDSAVMRRADDVYDALFNPQSGVDTDGVLLLINNDTYYDYLSTSGFGELYYYNGAADDRTQAILDEVQPLLKQGNYDKAIREFCDQIVKYKNAGLPKNAYTYDKANKQYTYVENGKLVSAADLPAGYGRDVWALVAIAFVIGAVAAGVTILIVWNSYQLKKSLSPTNYISQRDTNFTDKRDVFLRTYTTKTPINTNNGRSGGGGGSSHRSSGGHSHGGGGSRR